MSVLPTKSMRVVTVAFCFFLSSFAPGAPIAGGAMPSPFLSIAGGAAPSPAFGASIAGAAPGAAGGPEGLGASSDL